MSTNFDATSLVERVFFLLLANPPAVIDSPHKTPHLFFLSQLPFHPSE
jgi:hypothetical protein